MKKLKDLIISNPHNITEESLIQDFKDCGLIIDPLGNFYRPSGVTEEVFYSDLEIESTCGTFDVMVKFDEGDFRIELTDNIQNGNYEFPYISINNLNSIEFYYKIIQSIINYEIDNYINRRLNV